MKPNPILEEVWKVKDALSREAGGDIARLCEQTRTWAATHPKTGPAIHSAHELRDFFLHKETRTAVVAEEPPKTSIQ